jgi:hypothetical protein
MGEQGEGNRLNWPGLIVLATAGIGGLIYFQAPLHSSRPASPKYTERRGIGDQTVYARLWQDPLETVEVQANKEAINTTSREDAVKKEQKASADSSLNSSPGNAAGTNRHGPHSLEWLASQVQQRMTTGADVNKPVLVSLQMINGGHFLEDSETRLRARNAIVSALAKAGYTPWDEEHIDYITVRWWKGQQLTGSWETNFPPLPDKGEDSVELRIPFEWYVPDELCLATNQPGSPTNRILVCWLPRESFADHPLVRLAQIIHPISQNLKTQKTKGLLRFQVFDPDPKSMLEEFGETGTCPMSRRTNQITPSKELAGLEVYSSWSTRMDALIDNTSAALRRESVAGVFAKHQMKFTNIVATDDELAEEMITELGRRGVDLTNSRATVALLSEWDTDYGRALPLTFAAKLISMSSIHKPGLNTILDGLKTGNINWPTNILRFTYLRGLDGKIPGSESDAKVTNQKTRKQELQEFERPEGPSQLDYMPRLAAELKERDADARRRGGPRLRAIGILGSDVYDKLLLLQTLRSRFPGVLFFTFDLDARLVHPTELDWSRNVLVASSFGLELGTGLQDPIPPFRDTYQTGRYLGCLVSLGRITNNLALVRPQIFEIGNHGAFRFENDTARENPFYADQSEAPPARRVLAGLAALVLGCVLVLSFCCRMREWLAFRTTPSSLSNPERNLAARRWALLSAVILFTGFLLLIRYDHVNPEGEPFTFFEGISVWPSELIRLLAILIGGGSLAWAISLLRKNAAGLERSLGLQNESGRNPNRLDQWEMRRFWARRRWLPWKLARRLAPLLIWLPEPIQERESDQVDAKLLWRHYQRWELVGNRLLRIVPAVISFAGLAVLLMYLFGFPLRPYRGMLSKICDSAILGTGVSILVILTFFVVDAVRSCRRLIEELSEKPTVWPPDVLNRISVKRNMAPAYLDEWIDLEMIAQRTKAVGKLVYLPFIMLVLMIASRSTFFDRWDWPMSLVVVIGIISAYALTAAVSMRRAAEKARTLELARLQEDLVGAIHQKNRELCEQIRETMKEIRDLNQGAFAPLTQQPFFRAFLLILGGAGSLPLSGLVPELLNLLQ